VFWFHPHDLLHRPALSYQHEACGYGCGLKSIMGSIPGIWCQAEVRRELARILSLRGAATSTAMTSGSSSIVVMIWTQHVILSSIFLHRGDDLDEHVISSWSVLACVSIVEVLGLFPAHLASTVT
jgi:hypothetical protein